MSTFEVGGITFTVTADSRPAWFEANPEIATHPVLRSVFGGSPREDIYVGEGSEGSYSEEYYSSDIEDEANDVHAVAMPHLEDQPAQPIVPDKYLVHNILSAYWTWEQIQENPAIYPLIYVGGMVGYALSLPIRVTIFAVALLRWIVGFFTSLVCGNFCREMKDYSWVVLGAFGEVFSGAIGVVCPPAAYALDEAIQENRTIHEWYKSHYLSLWVDELDGVMNGNEQQVAEKKAAVKNDFHYFEAAKKDLEKHYLSEDEVLGMLVSLNLIMHFGFLELIACYCQISGSAELEDWEALRETPLDHYCRFALEKCQGSIQENKNKLINSINKFLNLWHVLQRGDKTHLLGGVKAAIVLKATHGEKVEFHRTTSRQNLEDELNQWEADKNSIEEMADAILQFSGTIQSLDREMYSLLAQKAFEN